MASSWARSNGARLVPVVLLLALLAGLIRFPAPRKPALGAAETRAVTLLARESADWPRQNRCFSCHNNGDAGRALVAARQAGYHVPEQQLAVTLAFLAAPARWKYSPDREAFSDPVLANLQFAAALADACDAGLIADPAALRQAASLVVSAQQPDGSWQIGAPGTLGTPVTWGSELATALARRTLLRAGPEFHSAAQRAGAWLRRLPIDNLLQASAVLIGLAGEENGPEMRQRCLELIRQGEAAGGGWGPYRKSRPEVFDTAVVLLALVTVPETPAIARLKQRGRGFLLAQQEADGGWAETMRFGESGSYAQRTSTTAWATLALLSASPAGTPPGCP